MIDELYSFDRYKDFKIFIESDCGKYYAKIEYNGSFVCDLSSLNPEKLLGMCKKWIDDNEEIA